jgi:thymidylate synthase
MTIFADNVDTLWVRALRATLKGEHVDCRNGGSTQLTGVQCTLTNPDRNFVMNAERNLSPYYACAELLWYLSGNDRVEMMQHYAPSYANYAEDDGHLHGAYGARIKKGGQLENVIDLLREKSATRQAVIALWEQYDLFCAVEQPKRDLPCTLSWQFLRSGGKLDMIVNMRSNDLYLGFPYDIFCFTMFQRLIASELKLDVGKYVHHVGSMHIYDKDRERVQKCVESWRFYIADTWPKHGYCRDNDMRGLAGALEVERICRTKELHEALLLPDSASKLLTDASSVCREYCVNVPQNFYSPLLTRACNDYRDRRKRRRGEDNAGEIAAEVL